MKYRVHAEKHTNNKHPDGFFKLNTMVKSAPRFRDIIFLVPQIFPTCSHPVTPWHQQDNPS